MNLYHADRILEVGSGTGAILREINSINQKAIIVGLDLNKHVLKPISEMNTILGVGELLPFPTECFDITLCHYFLMWVENPNIVLKEMLRVTRKGGWIACLAEPDYGGRLDHPASNLWKELLLASCSASDPFVGRKLRTLFANLGLDSHVSLQSSIPATSFLEKIYDSDIRNLERFLPKERESDLKKLQSILASTNTDNMFSFMPVFYALARK